MELFGDREALYAMPEVFPAALFDYPGVKQLFYSGPAWRGRPTGFLPAAECRRGLRRRTRFPASC